MRIEKELFRSPRGRLEANWEPLPLGPAQREELDALCNEVYGYILNSDTLLARLVEATTFGLEKLAHNEMASQINTLTSSKRITDIQDCAYWLDHYGLNLVADLKQQLAAGLSSNEDNNTHDFKKVDHLKTEDLAISVARARFVSEVIKHAEIAVEDIEAKLNSLNRYAFNVNPRGLTPSRFADAVAKTLQQADQPTVFQGLVIEACAREGIPHIVEFYENIYKILLNKAATPTPDEATKQENLWSQLAPSLKSLHEQLDEQLDVARWQPGMLKNWLEQTVQQRYIQVDSGLMLSLLDQVNQVEAYLIATLKDQKISPRIRRMIIHLILPLIMIRLPNPEAFEDPNNAARLFIRQLTLLGYKDTESPLLDIEMIQAMVNRIEAEKGHLIDSFEAGAQALLIIAKREAERQIRQKTTNIFQPNSDLPVMSLAEEARHRVILELRELMAGLETPPEARLFVLHLLGPWMMVRFQRYGEDSQPWAEARAFAALFFDAIRPATNDVAQRRKQALRRLTIRQAKIRIERSKTPPNDAQRLLNWLKKHLSDLDAAYKKGERPTDALHTFSTAFLEALPKINLAAPT